MALIRWEPFGSVDDMFARMWMGLSGNRRLPTESAAEAREWRPAADISETDREYVIRAELPAVRKEDLRVSTQDGVITIEGERKHEEEEKGERFHRLESFYGSFSRSFALPDNADTESIRCEAKEGVLTVHIPKRTQDKPQARAIRVD
jgi:HSP20 family protein